MHTHACAFTHARTRTHTHARTPHTHTHTILIDTFLKNKKGVPTFPWQVFSAGSDGSGKSLCLAYCIHHCYKAGWLILQLTLWYDWFGFLVRRDHLLFLFVVCCCPTCSMPGVQSRLCCSFVVNYKRLPFIMPYIYQWVMIAMFWLSGEQLRKIPFSSQPLSPLSAQPQISFFSFVINRLSVAAKGPYCGQHCWSFERLIILWQTPGFVFQPQFYFPLVLTFCLLHFLSLFGNLTSILQSPLRPSRPPPPPPLSLSLSLSLIPAQFTR